MAGTWTDERLSDLSDRTDAGFDRLDRNLIDIRNEIRVQIGSVRAEVSSEIGSLRAEVKSEISSLRGEVKSDISSLRGEVKSDIGSLRVELDSLRGLIIRLQLGTMLAILVAVVTRSL